MTVTTDCYNGQLQWTVTEPLMVTETVKEVLTVTVNDSQ